MVYLSDLAPALREVSRCWSPAVCWRSPGDPWRRGSVILGEACGMRLRHGRKTRDDRRTPALGRYLGSTNCRPRNEGRHAGSGLVVAAL